MCLVGFIKLKPGLHIVIMVVSTVANSSVNHYMYEVLNEKLYL